MGECVAVLVDALLPLRTKVCELACDRGDASSCNGDGGRLRESELGGEPDFDVNSACVRFGEGVRGREVVEGLCWLVPCGFGGAVRTIDGKLCCWRDGLADSGSSEMPLVRFGAGVS